MQPLQTPSTLDCKKCDTTASNIPSPEKKLKMLLIGRPRKNPLPNVLFKTYAYKQFFSANI